MKNILAIAFTALFTTAAYAQCRTTTITMPDGKMMKDSAMKKMASGGMTSAKMGSVKTAAPSRDGVAVKGKTKGKMVTMKSGGKAC